MIAGMRMVKRAERNNLSSYSAMMTARPKAQRLTALRQEMRSMAIPAWFKDNASHMLAPFRRGLGFAPDARPIHFNKA